MAYIAREARQELLDTIAVAIEELAVALAALGEAYEQLDEQSADRLEEQLFRPVQVAFGRAQRTHSEFAARRGLPTRTFAPGSAGLPSQGVKGFLERAMEAVGLCEHFLIELQDSMRPVEVGDAELRAGLAEVRTLVGDVKQRADRFVSLFGR